MNIIVPVREPNGRLSRAASEAVDAVAPAVLKRLRDAALRAGADAEWGSELGHLFLAGAIEATEFEAGKRWGRLVVAYHQSIGAKPANPKPQAFERYEPSAEPDDDTDAGRRRLKNARAIIADMREAHAVLIGAGMLAERAVRCVCEDGQTTGGTTSLASLKRGLSWLAEHWQLTRTVAKAHVRSRV